MFEPVIEDPTSVGSFYINLVTYIKTPSHAKPAHKSLQV